MKYLIVTIEAGGNLPPILRVIGDLKNRGHHVTVLGEPCLKPVVESAGASFEPFKEYFTKVDRKKDIFEDWKSKDNSFKNVIFGPAEIVVKETIREIERHPVDVLIVDVVLPAAMIAGEVKKIPTVSLFHMPEYLPGRNRPPGGLGLVPGTGNFGQIRDRFLSVVFRKIFNQYLAKINEIRKKYALPPLKNTTDLFDKAQLRLIQTSRSFDFPIEPAPKNVKYTGPVLDDPDWVRSWKNPWRVDGNLPLVVISLSTTFQNQRVALSHCIESLRGLPVRGLVTLGMAMEDETFDLPENVEAIRNGSHAEIFPHAALVITHAGHGTVMRSLANSLPMVCLPMGRDQGDNAAKVAFHGAGLKISARSNPKKIRSAVLKILANEEYKTNAARLGRKILSESKSNALADELEKIAVPLTH